jgi:hypothetical protein
MSIVYDAYIDYLEDTLVSENEAYAAKHRSDTMGHLWSSDVGKCHRQAILRVRGVPGVFSPGSRGLDYMHTGVITEADVGNGLRHVYGDRFTEQVVLKYEMWSGKADFGIDIGTSEPILIEHKTTSERHFQGGRSDLPRHEHVGQAMSYLWLYEHLYGVTPTVLLFYKAWGSYAEYTIAKDGTVQSDIAGVQDVFRIEHDFYAEIELFMKEYNSKGLPDKLDKKYKGCEFMGRPSCKFYKTCWGEYE